MDNKPEKASGPREVSVEEVIRRTSHAGALTGINGDLNNYTSLGKLEEK